MKTKNQTREFNPVKVDITCLYGLSRFPGLRRVEEVAQELVGALQGKPRVYLKNRDIYGVLAVINYLQFNHLDPYIYGSVIEVDGKYDDIDVLGVSTDARFEMKCQDLRNNIGRRIDLRGVKYDVKEAGCYPNILLAEHVSLVPVQGMVGRLVFPKSKIELGLITDQDFKLALEKKDLRR